MPPIARPVPVPPLSRAIVQPVPSRGVPPAVTSLVSGSLVSSTRDTMGMDRPSKSRDDASLVTGR